MSYNAIDLLNKSVETSKNILTLFENAKNDINDSHSSSIIMNIFIKHQNKKIDYYKGLQKELYNRDVTEIDCFLYDKISSLITLYNSKLKFQCPKNTRELIQSIIDINKDLRALYIDVRGRIIKNEQGWKSTEFEVLTEMITLQESYIKELEKSYMKNYGYH